MIYGHGTLGSVALRIMEDYSQGHMSGCRFSVEQAIEHVCWREKTLINYTNGGPCYVWWSLAFEDGELHIDINRGKSFNFVEERHGTKHYIQSPLTDIDSYDLVPHLSESSYPRHPVDTALRLGIGIGQRALMRFSVDWKTDYWGESDCHYERELVFVESFGAPFMVPVETGLPSRPAMRGLSYA